MQRGMRMVLVCYMVLTVTHAFCLTAYGLLCWAHVKEAEETGRTRQPPESTTVIDA